MGGWVKWWRSAELNPVLNKGEPFDRLHAFLWMVESAATEDSVRLGVPVKRGQLVVSERFLASVWNWKSRCKVRRFLADLESAGMIKIERPKKDQFGDQKKTTINVEKYRVYQDVKTKNRPKERPKKDQIIRRKKKEGESGSLDAPRIAFTEADPRSIQIGMGPPDEW